MLETKSNTIYSWEVKSRWLPERHFSAFVAQIELQLKSHEPVGLKTIRGPTSWSGIVY